MSGEDRPLDPPAGGGYPGVDGLAETWEDSPLNRLAAAARRIGAVAVGQPLDEERRRGSGRELAAVADRLEAAAAAERRTRNQPTPTGIPRTSSRPAR